MTKKSQRNKPIPLVPPKMKSLKRARHVTSEFHRLTHAIEALEKTPRASCTTSSTKSQQPESFNSKLDVRSLEAERLKAELKALGGRQAYQEASVVATSRQSSTKWVVKTLRRRGLLKQQSNNSASLADQPRVLEVGAINTELLQTRGLSVRAIDLRSSHPDIEELDVFKLADEFNGAEADALKKKTREDEQQQQQLQEEQQPRMAPPYDIVVASMVINCLPDALTRGRFLVLLKKLVKPRGLVFLTLPASCLVPPEERKFGAKARAAPGYGRGTFLDQLQSSKLQFTVLPPPDSHDAAKVVFFCLQRPEEDEDTNNKDEKEEAALAQPEAKKRKKKLNQRQKGSVQSGAAAPFSVILP